MKQSRLSSSLRTSPCGVFPRSGSILALFLLLLSPVMLQGDEGWWYTKKNAPTKRSEVAVVALSGRIYVIGGFTRFGTTDRVEEYDPATDTWRKRSPLPRALHHAGAAVVDGKIYVIGGFVGLWSWKPVDTVYEYDPKADRWSQRAPMPTPRGALAVGVVDGKIYAVAGKGEDGDVRSNEVFDPSTNAWERKSPVITARDHLAVAVMDGKIYALGGREETYARNRD